MRGTEEMGQIMDSFENALKNPDFGIYTGEKTERLSKYGSLIEGWSKYHYYSKPRTNEAFRLFLCGYMAGRCEYMNS